MNPDQQPPAKRWTLSRKKIFIIAASIIALGILILIIVMALKGGDTQNNTDTQATSYDRPGYDRSKLGSGVADPFAVKFTPDSGAVSYRGDKVVQACNLLTLDDITKQDIHIKANTLPTPIARVFNDGVGTAEYPKDIYASSITGKSLGSDVNSCNYVLQSDDGAPSITINAFQPFAVPGDIIDEETQDNYMPAESVEGLEVFTKKSSSSTPGSKATESIVIQRGKGAFYLSLELSGDQATKKQALLAAAAKNFVREQANTSGISKLAYDSPIFKKSIVHACDLIDNADIRSLSSRDAGPLVREGIASSIAASTFPGDKTPHLNISNECTRSTSGGGSGLGSDGPGDLSLTVEVTSFLNDTPAKRGIEAASQPNPNNRGNQELPSPIGDGGIAYTDVAGGHHIIFSKGRIVVDLKLDQRSQQVSHTRNLAAATEKLAPIAQSMVSKIKE
jgi:hypothetical protein